MYTKSVLGFLAALLLATVPVMAATPASHPDAPQALTPSDRGKITLPLEGPNAGPGQGLFAGADYLVAMQADVTEDNAGNGSGGSETPNDPDDGGWDWRVTSPPAPFHHTTAASPKNLYGATVQGLYRAYLRDPKPSYFTAMTDAATVMAADAGIRSAADLIFLMLYDDLPGVLGTTYQAAAKAKYDGRITTYGSATALAEYIRDARNSQGYPNGIIPWDIGPWVKAAAMLDARYPGSGYDSDADDMAEVLYQDSYAGDPGYFDIDEDDGWDPDYADPNFWWYNCGISGLIDAFSASGVHTGEIPGLIARILASEHPSGAIGYCYGVHTDDEDWQATAYCAMSLGEYDPATYRAAIGEMAAWIGATQDPASGGWVYSSGNHYPEVGGENSAALYYGASTVGPVEPGTCISAEHTCVTVPMNITRMETASMRAFSVTFTLSPELMLCSGLGSITEGTYLSSEGSTQWYVRDLGSGQYKADCAILGGGVDCGATAATGTLFNVQVKKSGGDGTGTVTVDAVILRDCDNGPIQSAPGDPVEITVDVTPPVALANLSAVQVKIGNDGDGTTKVDVSFSVPTEGDYAETKIYRKGYGNYPEYDDPPGGGVPATPATPAAAVAAGWALAGTCSDGSFTDETGARDFYYYVAFSLDDCGNVSAVSNKTGGTLNYHLGDVASGGNNWVDGLDISLLGTDYGKTSGFVPAVDVGPTTDYSVNARPTTDNLIDFEDLIMFAINFMTVNTTPPAPASGAPVLQLVWEVAGEGTPAATLVLQSNAGMVKGIHALVAYDQSQLKLVGVTPGTLATEENVFFKDLADPAGVVVDVAKLGQGAAFTGSGEVAILRFEVLEAGAGPSLAVADLRGVNNEFLGAPTAVEPIVPEPGPGKTAMLLARPNPFTGQTEILFRLSSETAVALRIFDASGRLVRTLVDGSLPAGEHVAGWDGTDDGGHRLDSGIYFYALQAGDAQSLKKMILLK